MLHVIMLMVKRLSLLENAKKKIAGLQVGNEIMPLRGI